MWPGRTTLPEWITVQIQQLVRGRCWGNVTPCWSEEKRHFMGTEQEVCRAGRRTACTAAAGRLEVPCLMQRSFILTHVETLLSYIGMHKALPHFLGFLPFFVFFWPHLLLEIAVFIFTKSALVISYCFSSFKAFMCWMLKGNRNLFFWRSWHVKTLKHYGLISYDIAIYTQCMTTVLNCLQLWRDLGNWGG